MQLFVIQICLTQSKCTEMMGIVQPLKTSPSSFWCKTVIDTLLLEDCTLEMFPVQLGKQIPV